MFQSSVAVAMSTAEKRTAEGDKEEVYPDQAIAITELHSIQFFTLEGLSAFTYTFQVI